MNVHLLPSQYFRDFSDSSAHIHSFGLSFRKVQPTFIHLPPDEKFRYGFPINYDAILFYLKIPLSRRLFIVGINRLIWWLLNKLQIPASYSSKLEFINKVKKVAHRPIRNTSLRPIVCMRLKELTDSKK